MENFKIKKMEAAYHKLLKTSTARWGVETPNGAIFEYCYDTLRMAILLSKLPKDEVALIFKNSKNTQQLYSDAILILSKSMYEIACINHSQHLKEHEQSFLLFFQNRLLKYKAKSEGKSRDPDQIKTEALEIVLQILKEYNHPSLKESLTEQIRFYNFFFDLIFGRALLDHEIITRDAIVAGQEFKDYLNDLEVFIGYKIPPIFRSFFAEIPINNKNSLYNLKFHAGVWNWYRFLKFEVFHIKKGFKEERGRERNIHALLNYYSEIGKPILPKGALPFAENVKIYEGDYSLLYLAPKNEKELGEDIYVAYFITGGYQRESDIYRQKICNQISDLIGPHSDLLDKLKNESLEEIKISNTGKKIIEPQNRSIKRDLRYKSF